MGEKQAAERCKNGEERIVGVASVDLDGVEGGEDEMREGMGDGGQVSSGNTNSSK